MNKNHYRLVFSRLHGMLVAVEETASAAGKASAGETQRAVDRSGVHGVAQFALRLAAFGALIAAGAMPMWAQAQIVGAGPNAPSVIQTPNGLPQVNINKPSGAGVSLNTYNQFDVQKNGAILNNSPTIVNTQQAGYINGNPNLSAGQAARIIVNQVNSTAASQIKGYVEIAGSRAEIVLANPAGIVVDGGGFINTSRAVLTTGVPQFGADGSLTGYNVSRGLITVQGAGLNASNVDQVDLIARAVQANAAIYAKNLNVIAGAQQVNHDTLAATPIQGDGVAPAVAIDVAQLGGMYANRVFLVGNSAGVGVANAGTIAAQAGDLTLQSDGRLVLTGKTTASGNLALSAASGIQNSGTTYAQQSLSASTGADVTNSGTLAAQQNTTVNAGSVNSTGRLGAGVNNDGSVARSGDLNLTASGQLTATGQNVAGGNASLTGGSVNLAGSQTAANGNLSLNATAGDVNLSNATTSAQGAIRANATGTVINDHGSLSSGGNTTLTGGNLSNQGGKVSSQGALSVNVAGQIANQSGELVSESTADLRGGAIANNQGTIQSAAGMTVAGASLDNTAGRVTSLNGDGLSVTTSGQLTNAAGTTANGAQGGVIGGNGDVTVRGGNVANHGTITSNTNLRVAGQSIDNGSGTLKAAQKVAVDAGAHLTNNGGSIVGNTATVGATTLDNSAGAVQAAQVSLNATDLVNHGGTITQTGTGPMTVNVSRTLDNSSGGTLQSNSTDLTLAPAALVNDGGTITHAGNGTLMLGSGSGSVSNVGGSIASNGRVVAQAGALNNTAGSINAQNGLAATIGGTLTNANGKLLSNTDLSVTSGVLANDGGQIDASTNATIHTGSMTNQGGSIVAPNLSVTADATLDNSGGKLETNQLTLTAANLTNHGGTITQYGASAMGFNVSGTLDNSAAGVIQTNATDLTLKPAELNNAGGTITHAGTGTLTIAPGNGASALNNAGGTIVTKGQAVVDASSWDNSNGILAAQGGVTATVAGDVNNAQGLVRAGASLSLTNGGALVNQAGHVQAGQTTAGDTSTLAVHSGSINNADGAITDLGMGAMTVQGGSQITNSRAGNVSGMGAITGNGDVTISATSISNTQGGELSGASLHVQAAALDNSGGKIGSVANSSGNVDVTASAAITNTNGQISSTHDLTITAPTLQGGAYSAAHDVRVNLQGDYTTTPDTQFNVGNDLTFALPGTFTNNAGFQTINGLNINAANIVNSGALSAGGLLHTQSSNLSNTGSLVGGSVSLNATGTVSNVGPTALIGASDSNGKLEILAHDIENRDDTTATDSMPTTAIFGMGKVVLAGGKDASGNYTNAALVNNSSALIQSGSDMELHADKVTSTRRVMSTTGSTSNVDPAVLAQYGISLSGCAAYFTGNCTGQTSYGIRSDNLTPDMRDVLLKQPGGMYIEPPHGGQWNSSYQYTTYTGTAVANMVTALSPAAQIVSGGKIDASSTGTLQNYWSSITAVGNLTMPQHYDSDGWAATGQQAPTVTVTYSGQYHYNNYDNSEHNWQLPFGDATFVTGHPGGYTQVAPADVKQYKLPGYFSTMSSNGTISGTGVSVNNTAGNASLPSLGLLPGQSVPGLTPTNLSGNASGAKSGASSVHGGPPAPVNPIIASATALNVLNNLTIPQGGLFKPTTAPNANYVIETNPAFTNQKNFISSDYFFGQLGVDLTHIPKRLGDGFYEQQLVRNQVTGLTGKAVLGPYADLQTMYQSLMAAGADLSKSLDMPMGASLSAEQVSKLTSNVIMMETRVVDGQSVLVPVVYLAKASQQNIDGPLISATNIDFQNAQAFTNSGTIKADNTLAIQGKQIDNAFGALQSGGLMSLKTENNIDLTSANVKAGSLQLDAGKDLILDTATKTNTRVSRDGATSVVTTLGPTAKLDVAGDASIVTGGNFQQNAGNLSVGGNLGMNVGGNWDLGAVQTGEHKIVQRANGVSNTDINKVTGSKVTVGGQSSIGVGGDLTATGAQIDFGQGGTIAAKGNVTLGAASSTSTVNSNSSGSDSHGSYAETLHTSDQSLTGTTLTSGQNLAIASGKDITVKGSSISLDKGTASLLAVGDVNVESATETHVLNSHETHSHSGVLSGSKVASGVDQTATYNQASTISADGVTIASGRDINVIGSAIAATDDATLKAARDVNIKTSQDTVQSSTYYEKKETGLLSNGGLSVTIGSRSMTDRQQSSTVTNNASSIGSLNGNLSIEAGNNVNGTAAILHAGNDVDVTGKSVKLDSAYDTMSQAQQQQYRQAGVTVGLSSPVLAAVQTGKQMVEAAGKTKGDARLTALAAATTGLAAKNAYDATGGGNPATTAKSVGINISLGASKSDSQSQAQASTAVGSTVSAGRNVSITATGAGTDSNIDVIGSTISAGGNTKLAADGKVNLQAAESTSSQHSTNSGGSAGIGVSIGFGQQSGIAFTAGVAGNRGNANGESAAWTNTHVTAGNTLTIQSGGDTNLKGAVASGKQVVANVGGNLNVESLQDTDHYDSKQQSAGVSVSVCVPPICYGSSSVSGNISQQKMHSDYAAVAEQSGIKAGDGGYQVDVKGNTDLKGGVIASSDKAVQDGVSSLTTASLTYSDIQNHASYDASSVGISGGYGGTIGKNQKGTADNVNPVAGTDLPNRGGFSATPPIALSASGDASSTTRSGISGGSIRITDSAKQQQLTGKTADETIASVNRDTSNTGGALAPIFDKDKVQAGFDITSQFINQVGTFVDNRMKEADDARKASKNLDLTPEQRAAAEQKADQLTADWGPGGTYRQVLSALTAAAGGNVTGSTGQFVQAGIVNYLQQQGASYIGDLVKTGAVTEGSPLHAAMHAIVACAGAAASSQSCGAGAMGAASASLLSNLFADTPNETATEKQAKGNLISSIVAGVAAVGGVNAATATTAAQTEVENNFLTQPQQTARALAKVSCSTAADPSACRQKVQQQYAKLWEDNEAKAKSCASADACKAALTDLRQQQVEYSARENQLQQKLRDTGSLSAAETEELLNLKAADTNLISLRTSALQSYTRYAGMDALKSLQGSELIAELGIGASPGAGYGVAAAITGVGRNGLPKINGRYPINSKYADQQFPMDKLPPEIQQKYPQGVKFNSQGFPDFSPYAKAKVDVQGLTGDYRTDEALSNKRVGLSETPDGYVWHHVENAQTMLLIPQDLHNAVRHTGGSAILK
ncbi:hemagglutinin repeat-containing protein [Burkholderia ubonensis]|uniref:hemagglutinin repeat-containing protein n=1 Tax=Burkholderia ubonensis TaxID=101571 RepID=UPI0009B47124|nr:hemagglutinin repeat-containing protein [Burkholderia ubonensis]